MKKGVRNLCLTALMGVTILSGCYRYRRIEEVGKPFLEQTKITFHSNRDRNSEIYVMNADGSKEIRLTNNIVRDGDPSWSPDGKKIAFHSGEMKNREIYVMNADGSEQKRLTSNRADDMHPSWSPDGKKIAFDSDRKGNIEIYVMNADGSKQKRLTNNRAWDNRPSWSPLLKNGK